MRLLDWFAVVTIAAMDWLVGFGYLGQTDDREFLVRVSYMEIYNEEINDLLTLEGQKLAIKESLEVNAMSFWGLSSNFKTSFCNREHLLFVYSVESM